MTTSASSRLLQAGLITLVVILAGIAVALFLALPRNVGTATGPAASDSVRPTQSSVMSAAPSDAVEIGPASPASEVPSATPSLVLPSATWLRVEVELNLRRAPGLSGGLRAELQPGDVLLTLDGPTWQDGYAWYHVLTLAGGDGWIASGTLSEPYVMDLSGDTVLATCGRVQAGAVVDGLRFAWALHDVDQGLFELLAATDGSGCVNLEASPVGIRTYVDATVSACGEPSWQDDGVWLLPSVAGNIIGEAHVKHRVHVSESLLTAYAVLDEDGRSNRHAVLGLASEADPPFGCVHARVTEQAWGTDVWFMTDTDGCYTVEEATPDAVLMRAQPDGTLYRFGLRPSGSVSVPRGVRMEINVTARYSTNEGQFFSLVDGPGTCG